MTNGRTSRRFGAFRAISLVMALVFVAFTAVQYNDPDPGAWMTLYGLAAVVSALAAFWPRSPWPLPAAVAVAALAWAAVLLAGVMGQAVQWREVFATTHMINSAVEETRETLGLLIVAAWMAALAWRSWRAPGGPVTGAR